MTAREGFVFRHADGLDMLLPRGETKAVNAIRLLCSGEKVRASQLIQVRLSDRSM